METAAKKRADLSVLLVNRIVPAPGSVPEPEFVGRFRLTSPALPGVNMIETVSLLINSIKILNKILTKDEEYSNISS